MLRRLVRLFILVVTVLGIARSGSAYLYCSMAGTIGEAPCCKHDARSHDNDTLRTPEMECCQSRALPVLPAADRIADHGNVISLEVTHVAPSLPAASLRATSITSAGPPPSARAGPPPRYASDVRADLMIFRC